MLQTTIVEVIEQTSKDLGIEEDIINEVVRFQWKQLHKSISHFENKDFNIPKLGHFGVRGGKKVFWEFIRKLIWKIRTLHDHPGQDYRWKNEKQDEIYYRVQLTNLLKIRNQYSIEAQNKKSKLRKLFMILIPMDEAFLYNENNLPSEHYKEHLERYVEKAKKAAYSHFNKFPEHGLTLLDEITEAFDQSVLQATYNTEGQYSIEKSIILLDAFRTDSDALEVGFFVRL